MFLAMLALMPFALTLVYAVVPPLSLPVVGEALSWGDVQWEWTGYRKISPHLRQAVIAAEDGRFCDHHGVDWQAVGDVAREAAREKRLSRGASTIAMQTAKNLYYWYLPTVLRKPLEVPTALWIDLIWTKRRLMEVYLNIAQFGDGVYGAEAASWYYFSKPASQLSTEEASLLAALLPNPAARNARSPSPFVRTQAATIRARMPNADVGCLR